MTTREARARVWAILLYEPSWFAEVMSAAGMFLWGAYALLTDDWRVEGWACAVPAFGLLAGPLRIAFLFQLVPLPRVLLAVVGFSWWGTLGWQAFDSKGFIPGLGAFHGLLLGDLLTIAKFSLIAILDNRARVTG